MDLAAEAQRLALDAARAREDVAADPDRRRGGMGAAGLEARDTEL